MEVTKKMVKRDAAHLRKERLREIIRIIETQKGLSFTQLYGIVMIKMGLTKERLTKYLSELQEAGLIQTDGYKILRKV